jgi:pimeloyl-ACP methyl ester carboxylesterase
LKQNKSIPFKSADIHYHVTGKGPFAVLIHGFGEDRTIWETLEKRLSETHTLIIPDLPGSGDSPAINKEEVGLEEFAECVKAVMDHEGIGICTMIGHSMGGYISLAFAEKYPEKLNTLGLFHSSAYADDEDKKNSRRKGIEFIQANGAFEFLKTALPGLFYDAEKSKKHIEQLLEKGKKFTEKALIQYYNAMIARPDRTQILKQATIPILFVVGEHDKAVPFSHSLAQSHLPTICSIHILRKSAHMGMLEEEEKCNEIFGSFLAKPLM